MASLNKVMLIGRLTDNPEPPRTLPNTGSTVVNFRFAVGRSKKNPQTGQWENDPNPLYIDCAVFTSPGQKRDLCNVVSQYTRKGSQVYIEGRLQYETWEDKNGGGKRSKHKIVVESIELLDKAGGGDSGGGGYAGGDDMDAPPARSNAGGGNFGGRGPAPASRGPGPRQSAPQDDDAGGGGDGDIPF
jgi:single-strand DNA-binding protein